MCAHAAHIHEQGRQRAPGSSPITVEAVARPAAHPRFACVRSCELPSAILLGLSQQSNPFCPPHPLVPQTHTRTCRDKRQHLRRVARDRGRQRHDARHAGHKLDVRVALGGGQARHARAAQWLHTHERRGHGIRQRTAGLGGQNLCGFRDGAAARQRWRWSSIKSASCLSRQHRSRWLACRRTCTGAGTPISARMRSLWTLKKLVRCTAKQCACSPRCMCMKYTKPPMIDAHMQRCTLAQSILAHPQTGTPTHLPMLGSEAAEDGQQRVRRCGEAEGVRQTRQRVQLQQQVQATQLHKCLGCVCGCRVRQRRAWVSMSVRMCMRMCRAKA